MRLPGRKKSADVTPNPLLPYCRGGFFFLENVEFPCIFSLAIRFGAEYDSTIGSQSHLTQRRKDMAEEINYSEPMTVVCLTQSRPVRFHCANYAAALAKLEECEESGLYVSGSIYTDGDLELDGFCK